MSLPVPEFPAAAAALPCFKKREGQTTLREYKTLRDGNCASDLSQTLNVPQT